MKTIKNHKYSIGTAACGIVCILVAMLGARDASSIELSGIVEPAYRATPHQTAIASGINSVIDANVDNFRAVATAVAPAWPYWDYQSLNESTYRGYGYEWIGRLVESRKLLHIIGDDPEPQSPDPLYTQSGAYYSGAGYLEFGIGYQPTPGTRQGLLFTSPDGEQSGTVGGRYAFMGYEHGVGIVNQIESGAYKVTAGDLGSIYNDSSYAMFGLAGTPTVNVGEISLDMDTITKMIRMGVNYGYSETPSPPEYTNFIWRGFAADKDNVYISNLPSGPGYTNLITYDTGSHKMGYASWPTPQPIPNTHTPTNTPVPTNTPTPFIYGSPEHGDFLMYQDLLHKYETRDWNNSAMWNADRLYHSEIKKASPTPGDVLKFIVDSGTPKWAPVTPVPPTPQAIPDTPTPYHVPVEMTPEPTISHASLESILGDPGEIPDGSHYFITDGDTYLYSVAIADARFFVSGYTPVALPDYVVSGAGTTAVNGYYFEDGIEDGVAYYSKSDGTHHLFRATHREKKYWAIHDSIPSPPVDPSQVMYTTLSAADVPPTGIYTIGTGSFPRATVAR